MRNGTNTRRLHKVLLEHRRTFVRRSQIVALDVGTNTDRDIALLAKAGMISRVDRGLYLVPNQERPDFDVPRFWSNPDLKDPDTICALVVAKPTIPDITRTILSYGIDRMRDALVTCEGEIRPETIEASKEMIDNAWRGISRVARQDAAA